MIAFPRIHVLVLDEGDATNLDALALTLAVFGRGRFELLYADDRRSLRRMAAQLDRVAGVVVVDVDRYPDPKDLLAEVAEAGVPVVVVTDGRNEAIFDHALSVGAAACVATSLPARDVISHLQLAAHPSG
jgi:hypothetical protein